MIQTTCYFTLLSSVHLALCQLSSSSVPMLLSLLNYIIH
uniref:Uncharacterized protein n=1 Tax=Anguilla anguilla TaxID=7936 RepID=A0A0E9VVL3_ANGAN